MSARLFVSFVEESHGVTRRAGTGNKGSTYTMFSGVPSDMRLTPQSLVSKLNLVPVLVVRFEESLF